MNRDERAILTSALERAGFQYTLDESKGVPAASFSWSSPELPDSTSFEVDAPSGWLRVATTIEAQAPLLSTRHALGLLYARTGLGHIHHDAQDGRFRIAASLQAVEHAPSGAALVATVEHLARVRRMVQTSQGEVHAVLDPSPAAGGEPTIADAARALGTALALVEEKDGSFVGGLHEPRSDAKCALRIHTAAPGIFAFDAWSLPPKRLAVQPALLDRIDSINASLPAGAMLLFPDGFLVYRWACPYRWLDVGQLSTPAVAQVALEAFMRWRHG
jgi:hypothetical protein